MRIEAYLKADYPMAQNLGFEYFAEFSGTDLRDVLKTSGARAIKELTGADFLREFRAVGGSIRDSDFYTLRREVLGYLKNEERIVNLLPTTPVPESYINYDHSLRINSEYLYKYRARYYDPDKERFVQTYASYLSDEQLSSGEALTRLQDQLNISPEENESLSLGFEITSLVGVFGKRD